MCVGGIDVPSVYNFAIGTHPTVWYFFVFQFVLNVIILRIHSSY